MKKSVFIALLLSACSQNHNGLYVNHTDGEYSIADDTLEVRDGVIISHCGYHKIRHGRILPKQYKTEQLFELHPVFENHHLILVNTVYYEIH